jgi:hypothetical protein
VGCLRRYSWPMICLPTGEKIFEVVLTAYLPSTAVIIRSLRLC